MSYYFLILSWLSARLAGRPIIFFGRIPFLKRRGVDQLEDIIQAEIHIVMSALILFFAVVALPATIIWIRFDSRIAGFFCFLSAFVMVSGMILMHVMLFTIIVATLVCLAIYAITRSPFGRLLEATRDDEIGLRVLGKNTFKLKWKAMMISAFFAGLAGSVYAHYISYIDPSSFLLQEIILIFTIVIVGGLASLKGSIVAPFVIILIPEALRFLDLPSTIIGPARQMVYAAILILIVLYRPRGLFGRIDLE